MNKRTRQNGFTIVELLIVIVVIGILAAITIITYNGIQARSRDTQRLVDLLAIQKALELDRTDNGGYPLCEASGVYQAGAAAGACPITSVAQPYGGKYLPNSVKEPIK
jgi:prepilin-type N-terminal cleavage/methylation domain-containing protein